MKIILTCTVLFLAMLGATVQQANAASKGCITVQGQTQCGPDIPDNPTPVCADQATCDTGAGVQPDTPDESPGTVTDDDNDPDAQNPPAGGDDGSGTAVPVQPSYCESTPSADIGVTASSSEAKYTVGSMVHYTVDVSSNGPCPAPGAALTFQLPQHLELLSPAAVSTSVGDCSVTGGVGSQLITCQFGSLDLQQHASVSVEARADSVGTAEAEAGVSTSVADWNVGDNQRSEVTIAIAASPKRSAVHPRMSQSRETVRAQGLLWDGQTFRSTDEFAGWLGARGSSWDRFETNHPAAASGLNDRG